MVSADASQQSGAHWWKSPVCELCWVSEEWKNSRCKMQEWGRGGWLVHLATLCFPDCWRILLRTTNYILRSCCTALYSSVSADKLSVYSVFVLGRSAGRIREDLVRSSVLETSPATHSLTTERRTCNDHSTTRRILHVRSSQSAADWLLQLLKPFIN